MNQNRKLNFRNQFMFQVYADTQTEVLITINGVEHFREQFEPGVVHKRTTDFYYEYADGEKGYIEFFFSGDKETTNKYLKITGILVNGVPIPVLAYYYYPELNPDWWDRLSVKKKKEMQERIYGNNAGIFGWYGRIKYEIRTVFDRNSRYKAQLDHEYNIDRLTGFGNYNLVTDDSHGGRERPWNKKI